MAEVVIKSAIQNEERVTCEGAVDGVSVTCVVSNGRMLEMKDDTARMAHIVEQLINNLTAPEIDRKDLLTPKPLTVELKPDPATGRMVFDKLK